MEKKHPIDSSPTAWDSGVAPGAPDLKWKSGGWLALSVRSSCSSKLLLSEKPHPSKRGLGGAPDIRHLYLWNTSFAFCTLKPLMQKSNEAPKGMPPAALHGTCFARSEQAPK